MRDARAEDERLAILTFWWMLELFSPQPVPKATRRAARPSDRQVVEWRAGEPLPWEKLATPEPIHGRRRVWRHTVYLGVYKLEATYESLHRVFGEDVDAYDERPGGESACAGVLIDEGGRLVACSAVLSSALWAVARIHDPGPQDPRWMDGFDTACEAFTDAVEGYEGDRRDASGAEKAPPYDAESLHGLLTIAHAGAGIGGFEGLATERVVIESVAVSARRAEEPPDIDFLNSFYLDDLADVRDQVERGNVGPALAAYLTGDDSVRSGDRIDVVHDPGVVSAGTAIERLPKGRWPTNPQHSLALSQQFAVNEALNVLGPTAGLMGVNGPPGTGKTTMLRDILAANVVERARRLAALENAQDAFIDEHRWTAKDGYPRIVRQLRPELTGFEMVVASANNAAVENVTNEIPAREAIDKLWREEADYFAAIATKVLHDATSNGTSAASDPPTAWGLVAARLGRKRNRSAFHSAFWFDEKDPATNAPVDGGVPRMQTRLTQWHNGTAPHKTWAQARDDFADSEHRVDALIRQRRQAQERLGRRPQLAEREHALSATIDLTRQQVRAIEQDLASQAPIEQRTEADRRQAVTQHDRQLATKPGALETIFTLGRAARDWRTGLKPLAQTLRTAEERHRDAATVGQQIRASLQQTQARLSAAEHDLTLVQEERAELRSQCASDEDRYGDGYPGDAWTGKRRELHAPWLDAELDTARSELFLAALTLHQDFLANAAGDMLNGLRAAGDVISGNYPHRLEAEKQLAAWQLFFLTVPLVSTTFASASRMFGDLGCEAIGWLMIDEAGQASPQYAAGAIWRAQRVLAVGDPLQLQPVVTIPQKAQRDIANNYSVSITWIPPRASVQTLADRVTTFGTTLDQGEEQVWVSAPLRVHRRCDEPMFTLCNQIAYNGIMVNGVHRDLANPERPDRFDSAVSGPLIAASFWVDEPASTPGSHLQPSQIERLKGALTYLKEHGIDESEVIAISPFRAVADSLAALTASYPGLRAGTIHTAQGREAPVVILVLGGDPNSPGAKAWAASTPNLVNVAASRAQRRLYVIGDRAAWARQRYFRELSAALA
ncbi:MAG: AAA domain-containing protein [Micrococcales bacterium]|nr:AAA domain-containing protein [Micrococcales bacterium]